MVWMPSPDSQFSEKDISDKLPILKSRLEQHVRVLSEPKLGRNLIQQDTLTPAKNYISKQFSELGYPVQYHNYVSYGDEYSNIVIDIPTAEAQSPILIVGAHYDSVENSPGANDNASGVAALIEIGRYLKHKKYPYQVRLIAFVNEEPPFFQTEEMGSLVYATQLLESNDQIVGMMSLDSIGFYTDREESQQYPPPLNHIYPNTGNFVSFIGNLQSRELVSSAISLFRQNSSVPSEGIASPAFTPGVGWSDHWSFWVAGEHQAIMVTDTALNRYEHYHRETDTPEKLNYEDFTRVVFGLFKVVEGLANPGDKPEG